MSFLPSYRLKGRSQSKSIALSATILSSTLIVLTGCATGGDPASNNTAPTVSSGVAVEVRVYVPGKDKGKPLPKKKVSGKPEKIPTNILPTPPPTPTPKPSPTPTTPDPNSNPSPVPPPTNPTATPNPNPTPNPTADPNPNSNPSAKPKTNSNPTPNPTPNPSKNR